jgi:hypothetical protein
MGLGDYDNTIELESSVEDEFRKIEYDFQIHPEAARRIRALFKRLALHPPTNAP